MASKLLELPDVITLNWLMLRVGRAWQVRARNNARRTCVMARD